MLSSQIQKIKNQKEEEREEALRVYNEQERQKAEKFFKLKQQLENPYMLHYHQDGEEVVSKK